MYTNNFEEAFCAFLDSDDYDEAEDGLFSLVRRAFDAGWRAAGGPAPVQNRVFELLSFPQTDTTPAEE